MFCWNNPRYAWNRLRSPVPTSKLFPNAMKNILVLLVTVGIGYAYWYQLPDAPVPPAEKTPVAEVAVPIPRPAFVAAHTALDEPPTPVGHRPRRASVLLGSDNDQQAH